MLRREGAELPTTNKGSEIYGVQTFVAKLSPYAHVASARTVAHGLPSRSEADELDIEDPNDLSVDKGRALNEQSSDLRNALLRFFRSRAIPLADVEDLVQEVFLRILRRGGSTALDNLEAYAFATASSVIVDRSRRHTTHLVAAHVSFRPRSTAARIWRRTGSSPAVNRSMPRRRC